jgi:predicted GIY-YIG superfamily endonuclease
VEETMIYLLHLDRPLGHARHYVGYAADVGKRLEEHRAGRGARMLAVAAERGIGFELVRVWPGGREEERRLKRQHNAPRYCYVCRIASMQARALLERTGLSAEREAVHA